MGENCSYFKAGGCAFGTSVVTMFSKLRLFLPHDFDEEIRVSCSDFTFARLQGHVRLEHGNGLCHTLYDRLLYGTVMFCDVRASNVPHSNADLRGTPFAFYPTFCSFGFRAKGVSLSCVFLREQRIILKIGLNRVLDLFARTTKRTTAVVFLVDFVRSRAWPYSMFFFFRWLLPS